MKSRFSFKLRLLAFIIVCAMTLSSCSALEELLAIEEETELAPSVEGTEEGTENSTVADDGEVKTESVFSTAIAGEKGTATLIFENVAGVDGEFVVNGDLTVDTIEVKNAKGILCDIYDGTGDMKIFAYDTETLCAELELSAGFLS